MMEIVETLLHSQKQNKPLVF